MSRIELVPTSMNHVSLQSSWVSGEHSTHRPPVFWDTLVPASSQCVEQRPHYNAERSGVTSCDPVFCQRGRENRGFILSRPSHSLVEIRRERPWSLMLSSTSSDTKGK